MITVYIALSICLGALWIWANEGNDFNEADYIFITPTIMKELTVELDTTRIGSILLIGVLIICNFFTLPWSFFGLVGRTIHKLIFKQKTD